MRASYSLHLALCALSAPALAVAAPERPQSIYNGTEVAECGWPTTVALHNSQSLCSGTLVHPEVVIYAGHCGDAWDSVLFGEDYGAAARSVQTAGCFARPGGAGIGRDVAVCRLAEPVTDVPIVPILMGCELGALVEGADVTMIGFGDANDGPVGIKRETTAQIQYFTDDDEVYIDSPDMHAVCGGDSGGPAMLRLPDGSWRVFGITSYRTSWDCGGGSFYSMMHNNIEWFEAMTGVDLTPCHTAAGEWDPGPECGGFPLQPGTPMGTWDTGCQAGAPLSGPSSTCGSAAHDAPADTEPPQVEIVAPEQGQEYESEGELSLTIVAVAHDGVDQTDGWNIDHVRLLLDGEEIANSSLQFPPYEWTLSLPSGAYLISAAAVDRAGNEAIAAPRAIGIHTPPPLPADDPTTGESPTTDSSTGNVETTTLGTDTDGDATAGATGDEAGCGCRQRDGSAGALALLALLGLRRRRASAHERLLIEEPHLS